MEDSTKGGARPTGWDRRSLRDPHHDPDKAGRVKAMFNAIAPSYERINTIATLGRDAHWRRRAAAAADVRAGDVVLDLCCGTGDMLRVFAQLNPPPARIIGVDFAREMLAHGDFDRLTVPLTRLQADVLALPIRDASVDVVSCAFGVRNFQDLPAGLLEMYRVLRPGGRVVILEFATPENPVLRWGYRLYCDVLLPRLGSLVSGDKTGAYRYLPRSIQTFATRRSMARSLAGVGFSQVTTRSLNFGGVVIYRGERR